MKNSILPILLFGCILLSACSKTPFNEGDLGVTWEIVQNSFDQGEETKAAFTFFNQGQGIIENEDWIMYFNQANVRPKRMIHDQLGIVEHINGDFYRFVPGASFKLEPGASLNFEYVYDGLMIKEGDAPKGVYVVKNEHTQGELIEEIKNYAVKPLDELSSIFPAPSWQATVPTPRSEYQKNTAWAIPGLDLAGRIIPTPYTRTMGTGTVTLSSETIILYEPEFSFEADYLGNVIRELTGWQLQKQTVDQGGPDKIQLGMGNSNSINQDEAYTLLIEEGDGIRITGGKAGIFYGIQTLVSLIPAEAFTTGSITVNIPALKIEDRPRFPFRGFLLDVSRNFHNKEALLKLVDLLAYYKINALNLRLTDDEGWRLEIPGLPELTELGSLRGHTLDDKKWLHPAYGSGPDPYRDGNRGSGYYSRLDFIEILEYANNRHVQIIPEICFPSHARSAIKSMELRHDRLMTDGKQDLAEEYRLIDPADSSVYLSAQSFKDNIVCVARESTYRFYEKVVDEISHMYDEAGVPFTKFHTGGDEVPFGAWEKCPACAKVLQDNPEIGSYKNLQGYFFQRMLPILEKYGVAIGGWEEVVLNRYADRNITVNTEFIDRQVIPYVWDNTGNNIDLGYRIANAGYDVILCNVTNLYFDLAYTTDPAEPGLYWGGFHDNIDPYLLVPYDVFKSTIYDDHGGFRDPDDDYPDKVRLMPEARDRIIGIQAQLWSETLIEDRMLDYYVMPKLFAFAEKAWARAPKWETEPDNLERIAQARNGWAELANIIGQKELPRLDKLFGGYGYRITPPGGIIEDGILYANAAFPGLIIRYTTDGSEPNGTSAKYEKPVKVDGPVKLGAFAVSGRGSKTVDISSE